VTLGSFGYLVNLNAITIEIPVTVWPSNQTRFGHQPPFCPVQSHDCSILVMDQLDMLDLSCIAVFRPFDPADQITDKISTGSVYA